MCMLGTSVDEDALADVSEFQSWIRAAHFVGDRSSWIVTATLSLE